MDQQKQKIGVVGNGFVGKATQLLSNPEVQMIVYDIRPEACIPLGTTITDLESCELVFVCVPTPMNHDASCYTQMVESVMKELINPFRVVRSTVPIGFSKSQKSFFMPEFLTELNWKNDFITSKYWVMGLLEGEENTKLNEEFKIRCQRLFSSAKKHGSIENDYIHYGTSSECEALKLVKNCFLAFKVGIFNELYDLCQSFGVNYDRLTELVKLDPRMGQSHMMVPGYNNKRGFGGTCFPKDVNSLYNQFQSSKTKSYLFQACLTRNEFCDRKEREYIYDRWRTTLPTDKKISLVTGGAGFIGSNLCGKLLSMDHIVICLDNLQTGCLKNIQEFMENPNFHFKQADITHKQFFPHIDFIYHLACPASPPKYQANGYKTLKTNLLGTMNMLKLAKVHDCKFLFTSTSEVYGDPLEHPQKETYWGNVNCVGPRSCYDEGKRCAETLILEYRQKHKNLDKKLKTIRIFNTYGPKMDIDDGRVITNYIKAIQNNKPIPIYGDGKQSRSFQYIDDLIDGILKMMDSDEVGPINMGNPDEEFTMNGLKDLFEEILGKNLQVQNLPLPQDDPKVRKPDITLASEKLGWEPKYNLKSGIRNTFNHLVNNKQ